MKLKHTLMAAAGILALGITAYGGFYTVDEKNQVVVTRFGNPVRVVKEAGLKFKFPFVDKIHSFEKRVLEWDESAKSCITLDKERILIDAYARWKIENPLLFLKAVQTEAGAQTRLDDVIYNALKLVQKHNLMETVRYSNRKITTTEVGTGGQAIAGEKIEKGREKLLEEITQICADKAAREYGIKILDVRIKRADLPIEISKKVYARMASERERISEKYRSEGEGEALKILGQRDLEEKKIISEAYKEAKQIEGEADGKAVAIYAKAYNKDPEFYEFMKTLELYENSLDGNTKVIFSTNSRVMRLLKDLPKSKNTPRIYEKKEEKK